MPLEIKELHIRVTVNQPQPEGGSAPAAQSAGAGDKPDEQALIQQCVEQVLEIFNNKNER